jgi:hypothetical protein
VSFSFSSLHFLDNFFLPVFLLSLLIWLVIYDALLPHLCPSSTLGFLLKPEPFLHYMPLRNVWPFVLRYSSYIRLYSTSLNLFQLAPGDDLIMSNMYSLLNYIAATSKDKYDVNSIHILSVNSHIRNNTHSLESGLRGLSEDEKRLIGISTISVVTRLALEFKVEEASSTCSWGIIINLGQNIGYSTHNLHALTTFTRCGTNCRSGNYLQSRKPGVGSSTGLFQ